MTDEQQALIKAMTDLTVSNEEKIKTMKELDSTLKQILHCLRVN